MSTQAPFLYQSERYGDIYDGFPSAPFDPKAVTRASFQSQRPRPKPNGPLVSINRHPDAHEAPKQRSIYWKPMGDRTKWWIKATRVFQLCLRVLEGLAGAGLLVMFILFKGTGDSVAWVMRITSGVVMLACIYAVYHLSRGANARTPGSSAGYHSFSATFDLVVIPLYTYGDLAVRNHGSTWTSMIMNSSTEYMIPATYYGLIGSAGAHLLSLMISVFLALMFRRIHRMPPDMNPLESHLTARTTHKRNKSSVATSTAYADSIEKRYSTVTLEEHRRSGQPYQDVARPPAIPFMHTRQNSQESLRSSLRTRDSRSDFPARQYQIVPSNTSPRHSGASELSLSSNRLSAGPHSPTKLVSTRTSYASIPLHDSDPRPSRPTTSGTRPGTTSTYRTSYTSQVGPPTPRHSTGPPGTPPRQSTPNSNPSREPKFSEAWYASESLVSRTQAHLNRTQALAALNGNGNPASNKTYTPLDQSYDDVSSDDENDLSHPALHPLRSNPTSPALPQSASPRPSQGHSPTPSPRPGHFHQPSIPNLHLNRNSPLSEITLNDGRLSGHDIADQRLSVGEVGVKTLNRKSSIQAETEFYAKSYGQLREGTPPVMLTPGRQVSSGNDYDSGKFGGRFSVFGRRNVSGKVVEEGRARGY